MRTRSMIMVVTAAAALLLAGCGDGTEDPEPTDLPGTSTPGPGLPTLSPPQPPRTPPPQLPTLPTGEIEISGEVTAGVEPGCTLLETDTGVEFLLFGEAAEQVQVGTTATVRGEVRADMASTCQQGTPFEVSEVLD